ncbi:hypothetical protein ACFY2K_26165 [Kitasatospora sp. NPDC001309]|uniref:hypothetical protein n=1 Tax=Kitasatospora sp. NPDC001309 TaxID=3364013 RepID=UPI0036A34C15
MTDTLTAFDPVDYLPLAKSVSRSYARDWPGIDADDLFGHLSLKLVERRFYFEKSEHRNATVSALLRKEAARYCGKERGKALYGTADYLYSNSEVEQILENVFQPADEWGQQSRNGAVLADWSHGVERGRDGTGYVDAVIDARGAFKGLTEAQADTLRADWVYGPSEAAQRAGKSLAAWSMAHSRAVTRLRDLMNGSRMKRTADHDGPGSRKAVSNSQARYTTE